MVFGHVIKGEDVVRVMEKQKTDANSRPFVDVRISKCGELVLQVKKKGKDAHKLATVHFLYPQYKDIQCIFSIKSWLGYWDGI